MESCMETIVLALHIIVCLFLIVVVLLQSGKEGMGVVFGGGSSSLFGSSGAGGLLVKVTAVAVAIFLSTSLLSNYLGKTRLAVDQGSVMDTMEPAAATGNATEEDSLAPELLIEEIGNATPDFTVKTQDEASEADNTSPEAEANQTQ